MTARLFNIAAAFAAIISLSFASAHAEDDVILVLDASGSMWGQIDGEAKIVTAKRVINELLTDLPADKKLGLVAYGHNRKGDCTDIEEIAVVGADRAAIGAAVNKLNPKGKTPLSASVKFAAEKLKSTENKATVILISDGIETCNLDPCAVGAELERTGVDFTAHVIGFDVTVESDQAQLQCLAENTGGRYLNASNAAELSAALAETVIEEPDAQTTGFALRATELSGGPLIESGLSWKVQQAGGGEILFEIEDAGETTVELPPGTYDIFVERPADGLTGAAKNVTLPPDAEKTVTVPLELNFEATIRTVPEASAPVSAEIIVYWTGPNRESDYVTITALGANANAYMSYEYTRKGNPLTLRMPSDAGNYEVRYVLGRPATVLASAPISAVAVEASLEAADNVAAGAAFDVTWQGPGYNDDWVTIVKPNARDNAYLSYQYTREGNPLTLTAPLEAGDFELRYVQAGERVIARRAISVSSVEATITGPATAMAGTRHAISWTGPGDDGDWMTVTAPTAAENTYTDYEYMKNGNPLTLRMPLEAGEYELRYVQAGKKVIARKAITITAGEASLVAPETANVGETVIVEWSGPAENGDWVTVVKPTDADSKYGDYAYPKNGNPLELDIPLEPGAYEFRYVLDGKKVITRSAVTINDVEATLSAPQSVAAGGALNVDWTGPGYHRDYITITEPGAAEGHYLDYKYSRNGSPAQLQAPTTPGDYELRYVLGGKRVIARQAITVTAAN